MTIHWKRKSIEGKRDLKEKMYIFQSQGEHFHDLSLSKAIVGLRAVPEMYVLSVFFSTDRKMSLLWNFFSLASQCSN